MLLIFGSMMYFIVKEGEDIQAHTTVPTLNTTPQNMGEGFLIFWDSVTHHIHSPIGILLRQTIKIAMICRSKIPIGECI